MIICTLDCCTNNDLISLKENECYVAKRIAVSCPSFAYFQIIGGKVGANWTYDNRVYDNVITVSNYVDSIRTDTVYIRVTKSRDWRNCQIAGACPTTISLTPPSGIPYCLKGLATIKCPNEN